MKNSRHYIMVGMSGGVDSSVAAYLLKKQGHHVEGLFMKNWEDDDTDSYCPASKDMEDAQSVCDQLKIELHRVNFAAEYWENVFSHFLKEYQAGRTPNPDILCNKEIKFKSFLNYAKLRGVDYIATGHYARTSVNSDEILLKKGIDIGKDQSYFLYALNQTQLSQSLFPLGDLSKHQVRQIATSVGFKNHDKKDSTGICFIGERKFKDFLSEYIPSKPGVIKTVDGESLGTHDGLMFYTLGQRQGLKIGGIKNAVEAPWYVVQKNISQNELIVAQGEHPLLFSKIVTANQIHWIGKKPQFPFEVKAKTRYRQHDQTCMITLTDDNQYKILFLEPQRAVTPGQSIVFYKDDVCLGGGIILSAAL